MSKLDLTPNGNPSLFKRSEIKYPFMQFGYGQQEKGNRAKLAEDIGVRYTDDMYNIFMQSVNDVIPGFESIMNWTNSLWNKHWTEKTFTMPDGFVVTIKPTDETWSLFKPLGMFEVKAKVSGVEKQKKTLLLYVSIIHATDAYIAREVVRRCPFVVLTIHDAFRCLPNNANQMKQTYLQVLAEINDSTLLENIITEITGESTSLIKGDLNSADIINAKYAIC